VKKNGGEKKNRKMDNREEEGEIIIVFWRTNKQSRVMNRVSDRKLTSDDKYNG
jgi:hypothetical protein